jgi:hypothetical protein
MQDEFPEDNRARHTVETLDLGDPTRWGGSVVWNPVLPAGPFRPEYFDSPQTSPQILRIQQPNLLARSWDLLCSFDIQGYDPIVLVNEIALFGLDIHTGAGQVTSRGILVLATNNPGRQVDGEFAHAGLAQARPRGTTQAIFAIPATALAVRGYIVGAAGFGNPDAVLNIALEVVVAPRALL